MGTDKYNQMLGRLHEHEAVVDDTKRLLRLLNREKPKPMSKEVSRLITEMSERLLKRSTR